MLLCIDIGNTNTVLATFDGEKIVHSWRIKTDARSTADELGLMYRGLLAGDAVEITGVAACSTVPAALRALRTMLGRYYDAVPSLIVEPGVKTGVQLAIDNPKEVGADRVVNTLAAYTLYGGPSIVVDIGTDEYVRCDQLSRRVPRWRVHARDRDLLRRARRSRGPAAEGGGGQAAVGHRQEHRGVPAVRNVLRLRRASSTGSSTG